MIWIFDKKFYSDGESIYEKWFPFVLFIAAFFRFINLGFGEMQQWDEALYSLRSLVVIRFGDFIDQSAHMLGGLYYSVHPPLYVWLSSFFIFLFGEHLWVFRFTSALAGAGSVYLIYNLVKRLSTKRNALIAAMFVAFHPLITFYSRQGQLDILLMITMLSFVYFAVRYFETNKTIFLLAGAVSLALALMTKLFYGLGISTSLIILFGYYFMKKKNEWRSILRFTLLTFLFSTPIWVSWLVYFSIKNGGENPFILFSTSTPLGQTIAGGEGSIKDLGIFYYFNQLVIQLSLLLPFSAVGIWKGLFDSKKKWHKLFAVIVILYVIFITIMESKFVVYLIPVMPFLIILAVETFTEIKRWSSQSQLWISVFMIICGVWSISLDWRMDVKSVLAAAFHSSIPDTSTLISVCVMMGIITTAIIIFLILYKSNKLKIIYSTHTLFFVSCLFGVITIYQIMFLHPKEYTDGASEITSEISKHHWNRLVMIGDGVNPQLTYYFHGSDIGWNESTTVKYERLEPSKIGTQEIKRKLNELMKRENSTGVIIEKDEITASVYRSYKDVISDPCTIIKDTKRYTLLSLP